MYIPTTQLVTSQELFLLYENILTVNAASLDTSPASLAGYKDLLITGEFRTNTGSNTRGMNLRFNGDAGANYSFQYSQVNNTTVTGALSTAQAAVAAGLVLPSDATANFFSSAQVVIVDYANTSRNKICQFTTTALHQTAAQVFTRTGGGMWLSTAAITRIEFLEGSVDLAAGSRMAVYGLK